MRVRDRTCGSTWRSERCFRLFIQSTNFIEHLLGARTELSTGAQQRTDRKPPHLCGALPRVAQIDDDHGDGWTAPCRENKVGEEAGGWAAFWKGSAERVS